MCHVVTLADDCSGDSAYAAHWKDLVNVVYVRDWDFFHWRGRAVKNDVVVVDLYCVALGVKLFGCAILSRFQLQKSFHMLETVGQKLFLEHSWLQWKRTHIPNVVFSYVLIHVLVYSCRVYVVREDRKFCWED